MVKENREMLIKIIDWSSRIIAVVLAIESSFLFIGFANAVDPEEFGWYTVIWGVVFFSFFQLGLFFAPTARHKGIICRVIIAILMLPCFVLFLSLTIDTLQEIISGKFFNCKFPTKTTIAIINPIVVILYITQYYLLFKASYLKVKGNCKQVV